VGGQQTFKALAQNRIAVASAIEERPAGGSAEMSGSLKQGILTLRFWFHTLIRGVNLLDKMTFVDIKYGVIRDLPFWWKLRLSRPIL